MHHTPMSMLFSIFVFPQDIIPTYFDNPILRFKQYLIKKNILTNEMDHQIDREYFDLVLKCVKKAENTKYLKPTEMFNDVYDKPSKLIIRQTNEFLDHIKENKEHYPLEKYEKF